MSICPNVTQLDLIKYAVFNMAIRAIVVCSVPPGLLWINKTITNLNTQWLLLVFCSIWLTFGALKLTAYRFKTYI